MACLLIQMQTSPMLYTCSSMCPSLKLFSYLSEQEYAASKKGKERKKESFTVQSPDWNGIWMVAIYLHGLTLSRGYKVAVLQRTPLSLALHTKLPPFSSVLLPFFKGFSHRIGDFHHFPDTPLRNGAHFGLITPRCVKNTVN